MTERNLTKYRVFVSVDEKNNLADDEVAYVIDETFGYAAMVTSRLIQRVLSARFKEHGVMFGEWPILLFLWARETASQNELSKLISIGEGTVARSISRMEKKKLITRERNDKDKREYIVRVTRKGLMLRDVLLAEVDDLSRSMHDAIGGDKMEFLLNTHQKLHKTLREIEASCYSDAGSETSS